MYRNLSIFRPLFFCLIFLLTGRAGWGQQLALSGGVGFNQLKIDSLTADSKGSFYLGVQFKAPVNKRLSFGFSGKYAMRGADYGFFKYEYRNHYFDLAGLLTLEAGSGIYLKAGYEYAYLFRSRVRVYDNVIDQTFRVYKTTGFGNQSSVFAGGGIRLTDGVELQALFKMPVGPVGFYNYEIGFLVDINRLKPRKKLKTYSSIEEALKNPFAVEKLVLQRQDLEVVPAEVFSFVNLEELVLDGNRITQIPAEIARLKNLRKLSVAFNDLEALPAEIGDLQSLEELNLNHNQLREFPDEIGNLSRLKFLYIGKNNLTRVNEHIAQCKELIELDLAQSGVMLVIPAEIGQLPKLEKLFVDKTVQFHFAFRPLNPRLQIIF